MAGVRRKVKSSVELPQLVRQTSRIAFVVATVGCFGLPSPALPLQQAGGAEVEKVEQGERDAKPGDRPIPFRLLPDW